MESALGTACMSSHVSYPYGTISSIDKAGMQGLNWDAGVMGSGRINQPEWLRTILRSPTSTRENC